MGAHDDDRPTLIGELRQRCGTCSHRHSDGGVVLDRDVDPTAGLRPHVCVFCGCDAYVLHPDEVAALDAAGAAEAGWRTGVPTLPPDMAAGIFDTLQGYEAEVMRRYGWDRPASVGVMVVFESPHAPAGVPDDFAMMSLLVKPLRVPAGFYEQMGGRDPAAAMINAVAGFERNPGIFDRFRAAGGHDPAQPVVGWFALSEMQVQVRGQDRPEMGLRELVFVDVDERIYSIVRSRGDDEVRSVMLPAAQYAALVAPMLDAGIMQAGPGGALPVMVEALVRAARLSSSDTQLRDLF